MSAPTPLARVDLHRVALPLRAPHVAAHGTEEAREVVLVQVTDEAGVSGWGECPTLARPGYVGEWTEGAWWVLRHVLVPSVLAGEDPGVAGHPMASGAVRDALVDLALRRAGEGPDSILGPLAPTVSFGVAVGLADDPAPVVAAAGRALGAGAALVVLKVRPGWCEVPVAAVRRAHPDLAVGIDANASFTGATLDELRAADARGLALVEQPMAVDDHAGAAQAVAALEAPVSLDEAVTSPGDLEAALVLGTASMVTVKPARLGGVEAAAGVADRAAAAGWGVHVGGMLESGLGRAAARALAARPEVTGPSLVGPTPLLFPDDVVEPVTSAPDGTVAVPRGPGLAPAPDPERLARLAVDRWTARPGSPEPGPAGPVGR